MLDKVKKNAGGYLQKKREMIKALNAKTTIAQGGLCGTVGILTLQWGKREPDRPARKMAPTVNPVRPAVMSKRRAPVKDARGTEDQGRKTREWIRDGPKYSRPGSIRRQSQCISGEVGEKKEPLQKEIRLWTTR